MNRIRVRECNATRVGGREPRPNAVQLIKDECSIMPQIIGNIVNGPFGLEAPFTAFRIDGSDQIDIVCGIIVCKHRCDERASYGFDVFKSNVSSRSVLKIETNETQSTKYQVRCLLIKDFKCW